MTTQIAVKLPDGLLAAVDGLVAGEHFDSRSSAIRAALGALVSDVAARSVDDAFAAGYAAHPDTADEMRQAVELATSAIDDEPWEKWW